MPLDCSSIPSQQALCTCGSSLEPEGPWTQTVDPHSKAVERLGLNPVAASSGVFPGTDSVKVWFLSQQTCLTASPHRKWGRLLACKMAWMCSISVWLSHSATLFCWGVSCTVSLCIVPAALRCLMNTLPIYSLPQSLWRTLIWALWWTLHHTS